MIRLKKITLSACNNQHFRSDIMKKFQFLLLAFVITLYSSTYSDLTYADESEDIIAYRQNVMKSLAANSKMIKAILTEKISQQHLSSLSSNIASTAGMLNGNFPEGSDFGETDAKEEIWENKADFSSKIKDLEKITKQLQSAVQQKASNKELMPIYNSVAKACKSCHKKYREK
jgi:cytochrome c556